MLFLPMARTVQEFHHRTAHPVKWRRIEKNWSVARRFVACDHHEIAAACAAIVSFLLDKQRCFVARRGEKEDGLQCLGPGVDQLVLNLWW